MYMAAHLPMEGGSASVLEIAELLRAADTLHSGRLSDSRNASFC